jgi:hypothetical protein
MPMSKVIAGKGVAIALGLFFIAGTMSAQWGEHARVWDDHRFFISVGGGYGFSEDHQGMVDLKTELQFGLTSRIRLGLGVGYLHGGGGRYGFGDKTRWTDMMMEDNPAQANSQNSAGIEEHYGESRTDFRALPLSLNLYYVLPLAHRWNIFMNGGGSVYFGSFYGIVGPRHKTAWGGQGGLGTEYRLTRSIRLVAEASYRFVEFGGLKRLTPVPVPLLGASRVPYEPVPGTVERFRIDLNGLSLRAGVRFGL